MTNPLSHRQKSLSSNFLNDLAQILSQKLILMDETALNTYSRDYTEDLDFLPQIAVLPENAEQVAAILKLCNEHIIPVTVRGAGTGLSGGCLPVFGGLVLSTEKLNRINLIDIDNFQVICEPGVINEVLQDALSEKGLFYPPDPASKGSCFLGGNIAHSSGGPRALKYGVTKDYVLNLQVALVSGELIWTGANTLKNSTGYNLTQLFVGSEGTLGVVTKMVLKVISKPKQDSLLLVYFEGASQACAAVAEIFKQGFNPGALEFMEREAVQISVDAMQLNFILPGGIDAFLLIEIDGMEKDEVMKQCENMAALLYDLGAADILFAESAEEKNKLWKIRRKIGETIKAVSIYKEEDTVVPRATLPQLLSGVKEIGSRYGFESICYGHAGDGNLHVNIIKGNMSDTDWNDKLTFGIREIFELCKRLGGTISGEHGIGYVQKNYMDIMFSAEHLALMQGIKKVFDPNGILNPGKIFPDK
jgi:glycolate oxidase